MRPSFYFISLVILFCIPEAAKTQQDDKTRFITDAGSITLTFRNNSFYDSKIRLPVRSITIADYRFDSSKLGYLDNSCNAARFCKIKMAEKWTPLLNQYFSQNLDPASPYSLLIVIRSFWLQEGILPEISSKKIVTRDWLSESDWGGFCKAGLDIYIRYDSSLQALFKLDENFLHTTNFIPGRINEWFFLPFDSVARKLLQLDLSGFLPARKKLAPAEVDEFYKKRFLQPVLCEDSVQQGIFLTFADFLSNKPVKDPFRIARGKLTDEVYLKGKEGETLVTSYWGLFDGSRLYIQSAYNLFPAVRRENSFEIYGTRQLENRFNAPNPGDLIRINHMTMRRKILQVDMESGRLY
jgi:hypothetical protein